MMKVHKYETLYPRVLWVVSCSKEHPWDLEKKFTFFKNTYGWKEINKDITTTNIILQLCETIYSPSNKFALASV